MSYFKIKRSTIPDAGMGVFAKKNFKKNELLGEYKGKFIKAENYKNTSYYVWELVDSNDYTIGYIDGQDKKLSNWTRYVNCPCESKQENVIAIQKGFKIFYYAKKQIKRGEELFVWYGSEYGKMLIGKTKL